jgi:SAM-dependent methyltransferase
MPQAEQTYAFENARAVQRERLRALETLLDRGTIRHLESLGVERGWRCLEVGGGGGSIAAWLCDRVGPEGAVVATDLDTTVLAELSRANLDVRVHDVQKDDLPEAEFDLVHLRLLLAWLADPLAAARRLTAALKPGRWLLAEEMDFVSVAPDPRLEPDAAALFHRVVEAHNAVLASRHTFDPAYGRRLASDLADAGLERIESEGRAFVWRGGEPGGRAWQLTFSQLRDEMLATRLVTPADVDGAIALCADPGFAFLSQVTMAAWGAARPGAARRAKPS